MKIIQLICIILFVNGLLTSCNDNDRFTLKGLVTFSELPIYFDGKIKFSAQVQYNRVAFSTEIDYRILNGSEMLFESSELADEDINGTGFLYDTPEIIINIEDIISGDTITVWLDPKNKLTKEEYTDEFNVNIWKKESVVLP